MISHNEVVLVGAHRFVVGDATKDIPAFVSGYEVDMIYSDPPWDDGSLHLFTRRADIADISFDDFAEGYCRGLAETGANDFFVEQGVRGWRRFVDIAIVAGLPPLVQKWDLMYTRKYGNVLLHFSYDHRNDDMPDIRGWMGDPATNAVFKTYGAPGRVVLDPCIGLGTTARMAVRHDMTCMGMDIVPNRLWRTIQWTKKHAKQ